MSPTTHSASSRNALGMLLGSAASLFGGRYQPTGTLRGLDAHTLADIGVAHVGQGPATLQVAMTDTGRFEVKKPLRMPPVG